ncbi:hypothetical protein Tco_1003803 [Tanacetum coccineum]|uniref:Retrotransposon protein n=1 Tax=Tanacetum coccineum TaxID=301880 RepID=A0ABQ5FBH1_9ASTR
MPPIPDLSFTGLDEFVNELVVENYKAMSSEEEPKLSDHLRLIAITIKIKFQINEEVVKPVWNNSHMVNHNKLCSKKTHTLMLKELSSKSCSEAKDDMFLVYGGDSLIELSVTCYTDASWETDRDDLQSQTRYVFVMNGGVVDWKSSKQSTTTMSFIKVEYIATMEAIWIHKLISGLGIVPSIDRPMDMYCDNTIAITIADEPSVQKVHTDNNLVDPFTKPMSCTKHVDHARNIGLRPAGSYM